MEITLITLAEFHYELGIIGYDEYYERVQVALWLADELERNDPRLDSEEELSPGEGINNKEYENQSVVYEISSGTKTSTIDEENWIKFLCLGVWVFTKADEDSYPSVPHGHYGNQNTPWPKLNPYTGRAFSSKHQEDKSNRLSKNQMKMIWSDEKFKSFCREMIVWYQERFPYYEFPVPRPLRMPRWR